MGARIDIVESPTPPGDNRLIDLRREFLESRLTRLGNLRRPARRQSPPDPGAAPVLLGPTAPEPRPTIPGRCGLPSSPARIPAAPGLPRRKAHNPLESTPNFLVNCGRKGRKGVVSPGWSARGVNPYRRGSWPGTRTSARRLGAPSRESRELRGVALRRKSRAIKRTNPGRTGVCVAESQGLSSKDLWWRRDGSCGVNADCICVQ